MPNVLAKGNFDKVTPKLTAILVFLSLGSIVFGYDTGSFGGVQSIPAFVHEFSGNPSATSIRAGLVSMMSSFAFIGKFFGTMVASTVIERIGHRWTMAIFCIISLIGVIIEATSKVPAQFIVGRIVLYFAVGLTENAVPTYQAELSPARARGAFVGSIQIFIGLGGLISALINYHYRAGTTKAAWVVPVSVQAICPVIILCGLPFLPNSPRWLLSKGRREEAIEALERVRPREDVENGECQLEIEAIELALSQKLDKGPWLDLFRGTNLRRTSIACIVFFFAQFTGQAFMSQYGPRFFTTVGLGANAFKYSTINSGMAVIASTIGIFFIDILGRRIILMGGGVLMGIFLYVVAGLGMQAHPTTSDGYGMVACVILFGVVFASTWAPLPYLIAAEIGTAALREKTMAVSSAMNVISAFLVSFTLPYLLNAPYAALGAKIGWIYGSFCMAMAIYTFFFVPELKGRSLESLDAAFEARVSVFQFHKFTPTGAASAVAALDGEHMSGSEKSEAIHQIEDGSSAHKEL